ncbi:MAG TPA: MFS transporter [Steroidobacteraceae bacterium]|nr:MFS transporter [Steroidobacteraceae bacterium]
MTAAPATPPAAAPPAIPWLGLGAVLLGTFISTVNTRLSTFGLADIRGAVHAGFDEGAWITTAQSTAQMLIAPLAIWLGGIFGARRVLLEAAVAFAAINLIAPFSTNLQMLLGLQFASGLTSGFFVPLTLSFILRTLPPRIWAYGIAIYALNLEVSLNISASLEGWYVDHASWQWIYWQNVPLGISMALCLHFGIRPDPLNLNHPPADWFGFASLGGGLALIYAALDQGNRLDWLSSPLIIGLLASGALLVAGFVLHERATACPALNLRVVFTAPLPRLMLLIAFLRLTILSTAFIIPQFLGPVRGFRAIEIGQTLVWIAAPQLFVCLLGGYLLRRFDARLIASIGFVGVCWACLMVAYTLTPLWGTDQFLPSQLLQAVGQSFALSGIVFFGILHLRPQDALTFGAAVQIARLMGGQLGQAFVTTFVRVRGQVASNLIGLHIQTGDGRTLERIQAYAAATARAGDPQSASARGASVLAGVVRQAALTQGIIDTLVVMAALTAITLILVVTRRAAPLGPASHIPLFRAPSAPSEG